MKRSADDYDFGFSLKASPTLESVLTAKVKTRYMLFDYETYSDIDLLKVGAWEYSVHKSTEILCAAWQTGTEEELRNNSVKTKLWAKRFTNGMEMLGQLLDDILDPNVIIVAHNAFFERCITKNVLTRYVTGELRTKLDKIPSRRYQCTAALAASYALPRDLERACRVMKVQVQKDMEGSALIKKWCKPRKPTKADPSTRHNNPDDFRKICRYCVTDIGAERGIFLALRPLDPKESEIWQLDQDINLRGMNVDRDYVHTVLKLVKIETDWLNKRCAHITKGEIKSANQREVVKTYLNKNFKLNLPNLKKKTLADLLLENDNRPIGERMPSVARELITIRQRVSKTSTAKFAALELRSRSDGRIRDTHLYHGASTGRWAGRGFQPQNLPKGTIGDCNTNYATSIIKGGDLELIRMLYGSPMDAFSSCIRNAIIPSEGKDLYVADYAGIEARILFWVANHTTGLKMFHNGDDLYKNMAMVIYKVLLDQVTKDQRQVGKQAILGCGYQMGAKKFRETAANNGVYISEELAKATVKAYREAHKPVVSLWYNTEKAAITAVQKPGHRVKMNHVTWYVEGDFLYCELPSKRRLAYHKPSIKYEKTPWDTMAPKLYHWGVDSYTNQWTKTSSYGGILVENIVQAISRDLMAWSMVNIQKAGYDIILHVHDELVAERKKNSGGSQREFEGLMSALPEWAKGAPVTVEGWIGDRYRK